MEIPIGKCSNCGGTVMGWAGAWHSVMPPPPAHCLSCQGTNEATIRINPPTKKDHSHPCCENVDL